MPVDGAWLVNVRGVDHLGDVDSLTALLDRLTSVIVALEFVSVAEGTGGTRVTLAPSVDGSDIIPVVPISDGDGVVLGTVGSSGAVNKNAQLVIQWLQLLLKAHLLPTFLFDFYTH